ncbi:MAG: ADP-ribosylglycohydrolase family protein [Promethearchaeota archaeon]
MGGGNPVLHRVGDVEPDRVGGLLLGLAVGDAIGCPVEGLHPAEIARRFGEIRDILDPFEVWRHRPYAGRLKGLYSDDTQQALVVLEVMLEHGHFDPAAAASLFVRMGEAHAGGRPGAHRGTGPNFRRALECFRAGRPPLDCGTPSAGIGAPMKIAPIGIWHDPGSPGLVGDAAAAAIMVHADLRAVSSCCLVSWLASLLLRSRSSGGEVDPADVLRRATGFVKRAEGDVLDAFGGRVLGKGHAGELAGALRVLTDNWGAEPGVVYRAILEHANACSPNFTLKFPSQGFVLASVPACVYLALDGESFEDAVVRAVNLGKDADTVGAIVGALAGARFGLGSIPARWLDDLVNRGGLESRVEAVVRGRRGENWEDLVEMEARLTRLEVGLRSKIAAGKS